MEVIGFILIVGLILVFFVVTKIGAKTNMSDEEREKALEAFYSQSVYDVKAEEDGYVYEDFVTDPKYTGYCGNIYTNDDA